MFQHDLLHLIDAVGVQSPVDYHRLPPGDKTYFISRLYKAFFHNQQEVLNDLGNAEGLKLHFASTGDLTSTNPNIPNETFLKKSAFYSNRTLVSFPFKKITDRKQLRVMRNKPQNSWKRRERGARSLVFGEITSERNEYGGRVLLTGDAYHVDPAALDDLISTVCWLKPAVAAGVACLLPTFSDSDVRRLRRGNKLVSANFRLADLMQQFREEKTADEVVGRRGQGRTRLFLPYFAGVSFQRVLEIRNKEDTLYKELQRRLGALMYEASQVESERALYTFMRDVDQGVRETHAKFIEIQSAYRRKDIYIAIKVLSAVLVMMAPIAAADALSAVLGGASGLDYLTSRMDRARELAAAPTSQVYLPWLIFKAGGPHPARI